MKRSTEKNFYNAGAIIGSILFMGFWLYVAISFLKLITANN